MPSDLDSTLPWLVRLRWLFFLCQLAVLVIAHLTDDQQLMWPVLLATVATFGASNLGLGLLSPPAAPERVLGLVLVFDGLALTVLLAASGGSSNPFTVLYLVLIALSALVLGRRWTLAISALSVAGFALLFLVPSAQGHAMHTGGGAFDRHLYGMWAAFAIAAAMLAFFVSKFAQAITSQREQISRLREDAARNARLAAVTTLAAGAAHELGSPLATIEIAAHEAALRAQRVPEATSIAEDLRLILLEVDRCRDILQQLSTRAAHADELEPVRLDEVERKLRDILGESRTGALRVEQRAPEATVLVPVEQLAQSLAGLVRNGQDASAGAAPVTIAFERRAGEVQIVVEDRGDGIAPDTLQRVGEPFFTTKEPGRGLGLGVFLARTFLESCGGRLVLESTLGVGTKVTAHLPQRKAPSTTSSPTPTP